MKNTIEEKNYVVAMRNNTAERIISNNIEYLSYLGTNSNKSYFTIPFSKLDDFAKELKLGERFEAHLAERKKLHGFLPDEF